MQIPLPAFAWPEVVLFYGRWNWQSGTDFHSVSEESNDIAGSASVSRATCCRIFKKIYQLSPIEFLTIYRLNVSADLLTRTDESISLIAGKCGFNSVSYYSKLFLEHYGCQPHKYRNLAIISSENASKHLL